MTTLLKLDHVATAGAQRLTSGSIWFKGQDVTKLEAYERARAGIGFVPQGRHIFPHLTVEENLETGLSALAGRGQALGGIPDHVCFPSSNRSLPGKAECSAAANSSNWRSAVRCRHCGR